VIDDYLPNSQKSGAQMVHDLACHLISTGHEVSLAAPAHWVDKVSLDELDGVRIYWFRSGKTKNVTKIKRALNETLLSLRAYLALRAILRRDPHELILYYSPSIFWGPLISYLKRIWRCPAYLILRDIFPQWAVDAGLLSKYSPVYWYFKLFEMLSYKAADRIGVLTPRNKKYFDNRLINMRDKTEVLYNWAPTKRVAQPLNESSYGCGCATRGGAWREKLGLQGKVVFFFGGNTGHAQDMMNVVRLAESLKHRKDAHFLLVGEGDEVDLVKREIMARELCNMTQHPGVPPSEYFRIIDEVDVGVFSLHRQHRTHNIPGKLLGYMQYGIPILGSVNPGNDVKEIIERYDAGLISFNGDDDAFMKNAIRLLEDPKARERMGKNGVRLLSEVFSVEKAADQVIRTCRLHSPMASSHWQ